MEQSVTVAKPLGDKCRYCLASQFGNGEKREMRSENNNLNFRRETAGRVCASDRIAELPTYFYCGYCVHSRNIAWIMDGYPIVPLTSVRRVKRSLCGIC